ncbi:hypothetical protein WICPIJ_002520 [Wickerhamomyces pijperi]|uniref:Uncharacterized protein n=1 Tax=Wickerhamomyces pijperi TaxID=599730 RepID=A0A9P8Q9H2_WICPI|nr:hypothetical protein WICPIJ_002520 [Wickerhamomyces pijperi]
MASFLKRFGLKRHKYKVSQSFTSLEVLPKVLPYIHDIPTLRQMAEIPEIRPYIESSILTIVVRSSQERKLYLKKDVLNARLPSKVIDLRVQEYTDLTENLSEEYLDTIFRSATDKYALVVFEVHWAQRYLEYFPSTLDLMKADIDPEEELDPDVMLRMIMDLPSPEKVLTKLIQDYCKNKQLQTDIHIHTYISLPLYATPNIMRFVGKWLIAIKEATAVNVMPYSVSFSKDTRTLRMTAKRDFHVFRDSENDLVGTIRFFNPEFPGGDRIELWGEIHIQTIEKNINLLAERMIEIKDADDLLNLRNNQHEELPELEELPEHEEPPQEQGIIPVVQEPPFEELVTFNATGETLKVVNSNYPQRPASLSHVQIPQHRHARLSKETTVKSSPLPRKRILGGSVPYITLSAVVMNFLAGITILRFWFSQIFAIIWAFPVWLRHHCWNFWTFGYYHKFCKSYFRGVTKISDKGLRYSQSVFLFNVFKYLYTEEFEKLSEKVQLLEKEYRSLKSQEATNRQAIAEIQKRRTLLKLSIWECLHSEAHPLVESTLFKHIDSFLALVENQDPDIFEAFFKIYLFVFGFAAPWIISKYLLMIRILQTIVGDQVGRILVKTPKKLNIQMKLQGKELEEYLSRDFQHTEFIYKKLRRGE